MRHERYRAVDACLLQPQARPILVARTPGGEIQTEPFNRERMGPTSDPMAVVSQYGRVHGLEGLWGADASIMPDCIRANTNATTIMIGEWVADFIKEGR
jgi:GMC oxidoreductase